MKPTLKPGCLAMIIKSMAGNEGKIVTCVKFIPSCKFKTTGTFSAWEIDQELPTIQGTQVNVVRADWLIPINDPGLEIETTTEEKIKEKV